MKKIILTSLLVAINFLSYSQSKNKDATIVLPVDSISKLVTYQGVVQAEGISKNDLYLSAKEWFVKTFKSANHVIQMDDKESGKIIGKGISKSSYNYLMHTVLYDLNYTVSITVKDGRFRYEIGDMSVKSEGGIGVTVDEAYRIYRNKSSGYALYKRIIPFVETNSDTLVKSIKESLMHNSINKSKDDF